jgi:hypothetical protein
VAMLVMQASCSETTGASSEGATHAPLRSPRLNS